MFINNPGHMTKMAAMPIHGKGSIHSFVLLRWAKNFNIKG